MILANKGIPFAVWLWALLPAHIEFVILGWLTQLALGVALWILPHSPGRAPHGDERWSWAIFGLLNLGIWLIIVFPYINIPWLGWLARLLQMAGLALFVITNWQRIYSLDFSFLKR